MEKIEMYTSYLFGNHVEGLELLWQRIRKRYYTVSELSRNDGWRTNSK